jgi:hypothetical protein
MDRNRFKDALWYGNDVMIILGGAGGIGSWLSLFLAKAGFTINNYDYDTVESHNLGGQLFFVDDIGSSKVKAVENVLTELVRTDYNYYPNNSKIDSNFRIPWAYSSTYKIYVSAFDNMEARKTLFNKFLDDPGAKLFVDGRLLMEQMRIYTIKKGDVEKTMNYMEKHLFDDSEVEEAPCTMKQVSHGAAMIATHMTAFITNSVANHFVWKDDVFTVPYIWDYIIPSNCLTETYEL